MIQKKWFWVEHLADGGIGKTGEAEAKGRNGSVIRYYEAVDLADACGQAKQWWESNKLRDRQTAASIRERRAKAGLCQTCGKRAPDSSQVRKNRWGGLSKFAPGGSKCRPCMDRVAELSRQRYRGERPVRGDGDPIDAYAREMERRKRSDEKRRAEAGSGTAIVYLRMLKKFDELGPSAFRAWLVSKIPAMQTAEPHAEAAE